MNHNKRFLTFLSALLLAVVTAMAASISVRIIPLTGNGRINVNDKFQVVVTLNGISSIPDIDVPGANIMGQNFGQFAEVNNGRASSRSELTLLCRAKAPGNYRIGPIQVQGVRSNTVPYTIGGNAANATTGIAANEESQSRQPQPQAQQGESSGPKFIGKGDGNLFMRASVSKSNAYEQEALVYTVKLYSNYARIKFIGATASPKFEGFVVEESKQTDANLQVENYNGKRYYTAVIARYVIFPQMTGNLQVKGNTYTVSVDQSEYYRESFFGTMVVNRPLQLNVSPNDLSVNVRQLPQPKPADFSGGVGKFSISSKLDGKTFRTGEAYTITYTVAGTGNLKYVVLPELSNSFPKSLDISSPETDVNAQLNGGNVSGDIKFDYTFMPSEVGDFQIPAVKLVFFNPETGQYETSVAKGYKIHVEKGSESGKSQRAKRAVFDPKLLPVDSLSKENIPFVYRFPYWLSFILPALLLIVAVIAYRKYVKANADFSAVMSRKANKMAQKRLRKAAECMQKNRREQFLDEMLLALWGYIGFKMKSPTSELNRENVSKILAEAGIGEKTVRNLLTLLDDCEFAKYSKSADTRSMQSIYDTGVEVINELEDSFKKAKHEK